MYDKKGGVYCVNTAYIIGSDDINLLGILNSKLITYYYKNISPVFRGGYLRFIYQYLEKLPIAISVDDNLGLLQFIDQMLTLQKEIQSAQHESDRVQLQQKADIIDRQIDQLVYKLYGLTDDEIRIVEESVG
jgi:hypothetical protein